MARGTVACRENWRGCEGEAENTVDLFVSSSAGSGVIDVAAPRIRVRSPDRAARTGETAGRPGPRPGLTPPGLLARSWIANGDLPTDSRHSHVNDTAAAHGPERSRSVQSPARSIARRAVASRQGRGVDPTRSRKTACSEFVATVCLDVTRVRGVARNGTSWSERCREPAGPSRQRQGSNGTLFFHLRSFNFVRATVDAPKHNVRRRSGSTIFGPQRKVTALRGVEEFVARRGSRGGQTKGELPGTLTSTPGATPCQDGTG